MASAPINKVQDKNGDQFFPITHQQAVINDDGDNLITVLGNKQPKDEDLTAIAALPAASTGVLKKTGNGTWAIDTDTFFTSGNSNKSDVNWTCDHLTAGASEQSDFDVYANESLFAGYGISLGASCKGRGNSDGWYTIYSSSRPNSWGDSVLLFISRSYVNNNNESYIVAVTGAYNGRIAFNQLCGVANAQLISKIRVVYVNSGSYIIQIYHSGAAGSGNDIFVSGIGTGTFVPPTLNNSPTGTSVEFNLTI